MEVTGVESVDELRRLAGVFRGRAVGERRRERVVWLGVAQVLEDRAYVLYEQMVWEFQQRGDHSMRR